MENGPANPDQSTIFNQSSIFKMVEDPSLLDAWRAGFSAAESLLISGDNYLEDTNPEDRQ
jgi:hypothetical protein